MADQFADRGDGHNAYRPKVDQGNTTSQDSQGSIYKDGSTGTPGQMESVADEQTSSQGKEKEKMNPAMEFKNTAIKLFAQKASDKYDKGQEEHGGYLPFDVIFKDIEDEVMDMWFYIQALKLKLSAFLGEKGRRMFFVKEEYSTIEGIVRECTKNKLND